MAAPPPSSSTLLLLYRSFLVAPGSSSTQTLLRHVAKGQHGRRTFCSSVRHGFETERRDPLAGGRRKLSSFEGGGGGKVRRRRVEDSKRFKSESIVGKMEDDLESIAKQKKSDPGTLPSTSNLPPQPRFTFPPSPEHSSPPPLHTGPTSKIKELMRDPDLFSPSFEPPKHTVVLCHGLYGYGVKGQIHYWANVQEVMKECGVDLLVVEVPSTGSIEERGRALHKTLEEQVPGKKINIVAHSMGGLDARYLITHVKDRSYTVLSLTSIATPHRGSPVMDWFSATLGLGSLVPALSDSLPPPTKIPPKFVTAYSPSSPLLAPLPKPTPPPTSSDSSDPQPVASTSYLPSYLNPLPLIASLRATILQAVDSPAYYNLTTTYCTTQFNPSTPDDPDVKYFSIAARATRITPLLPLWYTQIVLDETAKGGNAEPDGYAGEKYEGNDGMVSVSSTKHGEWLGTVDDCNHWELRGGEGKLKPPPTPPSTETPSTSSETPSSSSSSSWTWSDINEYLPSYEGISKRLFTPSTTPGEGAAGAGAGSSSTSTGKSVEEGEKQLKSQSWAIMSLLGKLVPTFGGAGGGGSGGKSTGSGDREEVDASAREKKEGTEEKFELARFYRAVILNLTRNGL